MPKAKLPHNPVDCLNASLDAFQALQRDGAGRPKEHGLEANRLESVGAMPSSPDVPEFQGSGVRGQ